MDAVDHRGDPRVSAGRMVLWREVSGWHGSGQPGEEEEEELLELLLHGKAPWGFTLRGGTEHREPLVITKVEEGSVAAAVRLRAGDEMVSVNAVLLSGSRQEAICLVKSSHRTLTLVVRRKNDPGSRPHSWHSSKLTEEESASAGREAAPAPVWQPKHEARPNESSAPGEPSTQLTSQFNSVNDMERLDGPPHHYPPSRLSPTKHTSGAEPLGGAGGKRDSGFSCFSNGSSPPGHDRSTSARKGTSAENIFFKVPQGEGQPRYPQPTLGNGGWEAPRPDEQRVSFAGRAGPVWQVPEKKSQSPPPPPPPLRSDSFAATKVFPYPEGPSGPGKSHGRSVEKLSENKDLRSHPEKSSESRNSFNPLLTKDLLHPNSNTARSDHNHNQVRPNKLFSLSSNDVRQSHYSHTPAHHRQYSDESPFYLQTRSAPANKTQSVGSYYRSLQDLPRNVFSYRKHARHSTASASAAAHPRVESGGPGRHHYDPAGRHSLQTAELHARPGKTEGRRGDTEKHHWVNGLESGFLGSMKGSVKKKYSLPQSQMPYSENKERNGLSHLGNGLYYDHKTSEPSNRSCSPENASKRCEVHTADVKRHLPTQPANDHKVAPSRQQDPWVPQEDHRISPMKTPLLHSLAQESRSLMAERQQAAPTVCVSSTQDTGDGGGKGNRRSGRYATTLRKEIQQKRAQLQKSRSAATLTCDGEDEEAEEEWRSAEASRSAGVSSSNTYKDHLKEAQARVLQATSFQRRDLDPFGPEAPAARNYERVRGRKRLVLAKRTHSFSEPDKMDKIGVEGEPPTGSFGERRKFFEVKPAFSRPVLKSSQGANLNTDPGERGRLKEGRPPAEAEEAAPFTDGHKQTLLEQERLGTFAEYQATWSKQKKSAEAKTQGRYHSAENILDADTEEKAPCIHERSRSSPSADFYTQNIPSAWTDTLAQQSRDTARGKAESRLRYRPDHSPQSLPRNEDPAPGLSDHRTGPNAADLSQTTLSTGPRSLSPDAEPPQTEALLPPPRPHLGPETTSSSSQAFLPLSTSDSQRHAAARDSSAGPTPAGSPRLGGTSAPDLNAGDAESEQEKEHLPPPPSSSPSPFSSWTAALLLPATDGARSPSPQFAPPRLTDEPPAASVRDVSPLRPQNELKPAAVMDVNSPVRKVPVRIVHAESSSDREGRAYLLQSSDPCVAFHPSPPVPCLGATERPASSLFSVYTRPAALEPGWTLASAQDTSAAAAGRSEEDAKREELARDIMGKDKSLADILDQSGRKTTMDLMEGLFPPEEQILEGAHQRKRAPSSSRLHTSSPRSPGRRDEEDASVSSLVPSSSYYNTSAPKAELLIKMKDMQGQLEEQDSEDELDVDLASKKQELISSLARKLEVLREARQSLQEDVEDNETLGRQVEATVQRLCQPNQLDKFRMFVGDLDKVVSLLLSLSGRLARVENALNGLEEDASPEEKRTLTEKRRLLMRQHEDAKELKENLDRRERLVSGVMEVHLDAESRDDYRHFVKMKSALIIEQRKLEDKVKLGEEQLKCLLDSLPPEQRPPL